MNELGALVSILVFLVFSGLMAGGVLGMMFGFILKTKIERLFVLCGGLLLGLITFELIPESLEQYRGLGLILGALSGTLLMTVTDTFLHKTFVNSQVKSEHLHSFLFLVFAICIHNLPTGLALGANMESSALHLSPLLTATFLHHIPEGLTLMASIALVGYKYLLFLVSTVFLSLVLGGSFFTGLAIGEQSHKLNTLLMGGAIGTLAFVTVHELLLKYKKRMNNREFLLYGVLGLMFMYFFLQWVH
ncbi:ZIP family metal transporter [Peribacillus tepidiphilus]|uniref:ZIP family metal transporter n=1 Tax=Peribacillus tepidiphilus TaxID=2652445 RepID=UPI001290D332|nr:ZIP family metal transporter [Peribacillus tepidiphilus]